MVLIVAGLCGVGEGGEAVGVVHRRGLDHEGLAGLAVLQGAGKGLQSGQGERPVGHLHRAVVEFHILVVVGVHVGEGNGVALAGTVGDGGEGDGAILLLLLLLDLKPEPLLVRQRGIHVSLKRDRQKEGKSVRRRFSGKHFLHKYKITLPIYQSIDQVKQQVCCPTITQQNRSINRMKQHPVVDGQTLISSINQAIYRFATLATKYKKIQSFS